MYINVINFLVVHGWTDAVALQTFRYNKTETGGTLFTVFMTVLLCASPRRLIGVASLDPFEDDCFSVLQLHEWIVHNSRFLIFLLCEALQQRIAADSRAPLLSSYRLAAHKHIHIVCEEQFKVHTVQSTCTWCPSEDCLLNSSSHCFSFDWVTMRLD